MNRSEWVRAPIFRKNPFTVTTQQAWGLVPEWNRYSGEEKKNWLDGLFSFAAGRNGMWYYTTLRYRAH